MGETGLSWLRGVARVLSGEPCLLWVMSRHRVAYASCPLFPSKQTFVSASGMSAKCQKRTSEALAAA